MSGSFSKFLRTVHEIETEDDADLGTAAEEDPDLVIGLSSAPPLRQAVLLAAEHGASVSEIAEKLQLKPAAVRKLVGQRVPAAGAKGPVTTD
jgi:DNA-directed RNA polymerase specialized sigma24 family protein